MHAHTHTHTHTHTQTMELQVEIVKIDLKGVDLHAIELHCKVENGQSSGSSVVRLSSPGGDTSWSSLRFKLSKPSSSAVLLFTAFDSSDTPIELGNCSVPLTLQAQHGFKELLPGPGQTQVALLSSKIEGTEIAKFVGKVWFRVSHNIGVSASQPSWERLQGKPATINPDTSPSTNTLLSREAECACTASMPSSNPTVSIIFHSVNSTSLDRISDQLRPIACVGNSSNIKNDTLFHNTSTSGRSVIPLLRPITLMCNELENVELHIVDRAKDNAVFSASHQVKSLTPFKHYNWLYDRKWMPGSDPFSPSHSQASTEPRVIVSLVYRPSQHEYLQHEGLEFLVSNVELNPANLQGRNVVLCTQLVGNDSKLRVQGVNSYDPPFWRAPKKGAKQSDPYENYNISVIRFHSQPTASSAYFFFPVNPYFSPDRSDMSLLIHVYATDLPSSQPWWQASLVISSKLDLPGHSRRLLQLPEHSGGAYWEISGAGIAQPEGVQLVNQMCGVVRWKSKQLPFLTAQIEAHLTSLPRFDDISLPQDAHSDHTTLRSSLDIVVPEVGVLSSLLEEREANRQLSDQDCVQLAEYEKAVTALGVDILRLRQENEALHKENEQLQTHIILMENDKSVSSADQRVLESLPKAELIQKVVEMREGLSVEARGRMFYQERVQSLQNSLITRNEFEAQYIHLQEAHAAQQKLVRQLQAKVEKYRRCGAICKQQEATITQLESLLAQQAQGHGSADAISLLSRENAQLRAALQEYRESDSEHKNVVVQEKDDLIQSLKAQLSRITSRCQELETQEGGMSDRLHMEHKSKVFEIEQKLMVSEARANTLMSELQDNARKWATEKAHYELQLAECRSKLITLTEQLQTTAQRHVNTTGQTETFSPAQPSAWNAISY